MNPYVALTDLGLLPTSDEWPKVAAKGLIPGPGTKPDPGWQGPEW